LVGSRGDGRGRQEAVDGDDLIYDFVGPNVADGPKQQNDGRGYSAGHFQLELDGKP
jgi:hypothetical protein